MRRKVEDVDAKYEPDVRAEARKTISAPLWLRAGFWISIAIAIAVVIRRVGALAFPSQSAPRQMAELDRVFASQAALTLAHILPALAFVALLPFALLRRFSRLSWPERWLFPLGIVVGEVNFRGINLQVRSLEIKTRENEDKCGVPRLRRCAAPLGMTASI